MAREHDLAYRVVPPWSDKQSSQSRRLLHLAPVFRFTNLDALNYELGLDVKLPFGITVREDLS